MNGNLEDESLVTVVSIECLGVACGEPILVTITSR